MNQSLLHPHEQSLVGWYYSSLGIENLALLVVTAILSFALTLFILARSKRDAAGAVLLFIVPLPFAIGVLRALCAVIQNCGMLRFADIAPKSSELLQLLASLTMLPVLGMLLMAPSYIVALIGLTIRALQANKTER